MNVKNRLFRAFLFAAVALILSQSAVAQRKSQLDLNRQKMVDEVIVGGGIKNQRVIAAMLATKRHEFVIAKYRRQAYFDMALPIGDKQTISSPFIVSFMTESLDPQPTDKVLEIGTGSGFQAAVLSPLVKDVYTIEIVEELGQRAQRTLKRLKYQNIHTKIGDGFKGWPEHAPFDKIIVTCSPEKIPKPLVEQLKEGGLMIIPVGERYQQTLYLLRKKDGELKSESLRPTLFVPMTGRAESGRDIKPDPLNPQVRNGGFEVPLGENDFVPGWYYQRQLTWATDELAPEGKHYVTFNNKDAGRAAHLLQGFAVDGRRIRELEISARVRYDNVRSGDRLSDLPYIGITFFDTNRKELGSVALGPFRGTQDWHRTSKKVRVPATAREGILRIGLLGAVGEISFDDLRMQAVKK